jgi:tRNA-specific 2-thiouridylase
MSGGVDSSLAAALLKEEGYQVIGLAMRLWSQGGAEGVESSKKVDDARRVCQILGIPFHVIDLERQFQAWVIDYFCEEYRQGRTPNPCIVCNQKIKFDLLLKEALKLGADYLATGHYARIDSSLGSHRLLKAIDRAKDQSYFLYTLRQEELKHLLFPLGGYRKDEVRRMAKEKGLPTYDKGESQELCFIPNGNYRSFLAERLPQKPGEIVDLEGRLLGRHQGIAYYTIGQRHGLGIASAEPLYVISIDAQSNTLVVGSGEELWSDTLLASKLSFISGEAPQGDTEVRAKIRYKSHEAKAVLSPKGEFVELRFDEPQRAITPGQGVVFYRGDEVFGGGIIERANEDTTHLH